MPNTTQQPAPPPPPGPEDRNDDAATTLEKCRQDHRAAKASKGAS